MKPNYQLPSRRLVSQNDNALIARNDIPRARFINQWTRKTAFNAGDLVPILVQEIYPGDHITWNVTAYIRMATPLFPMLDNQRVDTFFFAVPIRLVWANWKRFQGEQASPGESTNLTMPYVAWGATGAPVGSIADHMGIPTTGQITAGFNTNVLPLRAYNLIWNQWFKDQNIQDSISVPTDAGPDSNGLYITLLKRGKSHDYFTSALPWAQKFTAPTVPMAGTAPVIGIGAVAAGQTVINNVNVHETGLLANVYTNALQTFINPNAVISMTDATGAGYPQIYADLSSATGVAINTLRQAFMIQTLLERDARGGTRYTEIIKQQFGVDSPDARMQRPEYIGGGQTPLQITPIAQTAPTTGVPLGALGGAGTASGQHRASYAATEHCYVIGLANVRSELSYQQGMHKMWNPGRTRYDFYTPALAQLGEQAVLRGEIYKTGDPANDDVVFGYQERWAELRQEYSTVTGIMRSTAASTIDAWHLAQKFTAAPTLSPAFIVDDPPMARVLAAGSAAAGQQYLADFMFERVAVRALPAYSTPVQLGRF